MPELKLGPTYSGGPEGPPHIRPLLCDGRLIEAHAETETHRLQDLLDLVQRLSAEVLRLQYLCFFFLLLLLNRADVPVLYLVLLPHREIQFFVPLVEMLVH